jgi:predicted nuclease of predicted toxin-antitoxin system
LATKLRLLLDECLAGPLAKEVGKYKSLDVKYINDIMLGNCGTTDDAVVAYAREENRIIITAEGRLNEKKFKICTHPGIVVLKATKRHGTHADMLKDLVRSGIKSRCRHAVTYLKLDETATRTIATFKEMDELGRSHESIVDLTHPPSPTRKLH